MQMLREKRDFVAVAQPQLTSAFIALEGGDCHKPDSRLDHRAAQSRRPNNRRDLANHRRPARLLYANRMRKLLQERRICFSLTRSRSSALPAHRLLDLGSFLQLCQVLRMDQAAAADLNSGFA